MGLERVMLTEEDALSRINVWEEEIWSEYDDEGEGIGEPHIRKVVHTFLGGVGMLMGADWDLADIEAAIRKHGCELAGPVMTRMHHGIVLFDEHGMVFIATKV